jgi:hypothetical protein
MTLGNAAGARVRLIVWCKECQHQVELDPAEMAARHGAGTAVIDGRGRLVCSRCGSRQVDLVVSSARKLLRIRRDGGSSTTGGSSGRGIGIGRGGSS